LPHDPLRCSTGDAELGHERLAVEELRQRPRHAHPAITGPVEAIIRAVRYPPLPPELERALDAYLPVLSECRDHLAEIVIQRRLDKRLAFDMMGRIDDLGGDFRVFRASTEAS
jgi:hypothetical protein